MPLINHDINFGNLISQLLGTRDRKPVRIAWLKACFAGLRNIHTMFLSYSNAKLEEVKYNGQTFVLEKMLQSKFGGGIYIVNNLGDLDGMTIGSGNDFDFSIGTGSDFDGGIGTSFTVAAFDFTVNVPASIIFTQSEMEAFIRKYKLFGTTFNIVIF